MDRSILALVTHDDVRNFLPSYAAGTLAAERAGDVRRHLSECFPCLQGLYRLPVGMPRGKRVRAAQTVVVERAARRAVVPVLAAIAVALGATSILVWTIHELLQRGGADTVARLAAVEAERSDLGARIESLGRELAAVRAAADRQVGEVKAALTAGLQLAATSAADRQVTERRINTGLRRASLQQAPLVRISDAEQAVARPQQDPARTPLWQGKGQEELGERMYKYLSEDPGSTGHAISKADLVQIRRLLVDIQRKRDRKTEIRKPQPDQLPLTLEDSIQLALQKNLQVQIADLGKQALDTEVPRAEAKFHPIAGASFTGSRDKPAHDGKRVADVSSQTSTAFISQAVPTGGLVILSGNLDRKDTGAEPPRQFATGYTVSVVQPLLRGGRVYVATRPIRDAEFDVRVQEAALQAEILTVTAQTKAAYYNTLVAEKIIDVTEEAIARDEALIEASEALCKAGLVTKRDLYSAGIIRAKDASKLARARGDLELARNALRDVLGIAIGKDIFLHDGEIDFEPVPLDLDTWIAIALERRPEILGINEALGKSDLNIRVARNTLLPQVDFVGSYGRADTGANFERAAGVRGDAWTAGLVFSYPLTNVAAKSELARARIERTQLEQELMQQKRQVELQVRAAVIKLGTSLEKMKALASGVEQSEGKLEVAKARFALGVTTNLDVTDAQESLLEAETDLLKSVVDYDVGLAELEASVAGPI